MKIAVCVKQVAGGELNPFDASALEYALSTYSKNDEIILVSMGRITVRDMLTRLTRLGNIKGILLSDDKFAGADTLATSYVLSLALQKIEPDAIIFGRQSVDGDTGQVGHCVSAMLGRDVIIAEPYYKLRFPSIRSKAGTVDVWDSKILGADISRCGKAGSPTSVIKTYENLSDRRKCTFIKLSDLKDVIAQALTKEPIQNADSSAVKYKNVWSIGNEPLQYAESIAETVTVIPRNSNILQLAIEKKPPVILWASDNWSKENAPRIAAALNTGLCADCTSLETDGETLFMYRPAFGGNVMAKIICRTRPQMATVRTSSVASSDIVVGLGKGVQDCLPEMLRFAESIGAETAASRGLVDSGRMPYEKQVGLSGKSIAPKIYIAVGISGAVHHISGIRRAGTIISVNCDPNAQIFDYSDYGITENAPFV